MLTIGIGRIILHSDGQKETPVAAGDKTRRHYTGPVHG